MLYMQIFRETLGFMCDNKVKSLVCNFVLWSGKVGMYLLEVVLR